MTINCKSGRCFSPTACVGFGHCRDENRSFKIEVLEAAPVYLTMLGIAPTVTRKRITISGRTLAEAKRRAGIQ